MEDLKKEAYGVEYLPKFARKKFESFLSNPSIWKQEVTFLHPLDWQKFYSFVRHCHRYKVKVSAAEIKCLLREANFQEDFAEYVAEVFSHGMALLKHV
jgi:hypothetical protein